VDNTVFVGIPGQVQEEEGGTSRFTLIPPGVWLVQRDQAYLFGGQPPKRGSFHGAWGRARTRPIGRLPGKDRKGRRSTA